MKEMHNQRDRENPLLLPRAQRPEANEGDALLACGGKSLDLLVLNARRRMKEMHTFGSTSLLTIGYHHSLHAPLVFPLNYSA